jgi:hypothetical protein
MSGFLDGGTVAATGDSPVAVGVFTCRVLPCRSFPGDGLPGTTEEPAPASWTWDAGVRAS